MKFHGWAMKCYMNTKRSWCCTDACSTGIVPNALTHNDCSFHSCHVSSWRILPGQSCLPGPTHIHRLAFPRLSSLLACSGLLRGRLSSSSLPEGMFPAFLTCKNLLEMLSLARDCTRVPEGQQHVPAGPRGPFCGCPGMRHPHSDAEISVGPPFFFL